MAYYSFNVQFKFIAVVDHMHMHKDLEMVAVDLDDSLDNFVLDIVHIADDNRYVVVADSFHMAVDVVLVDIVGQQDKQRSLVGVVEVLAMMMNSITVVQQLVEMLVKLVVDFVVDNLIGCELLYFKLIQTNY